jgi:translation initiation factor IF-3
VLDYSKYKYEQAQKQKAARKHQQQINVREIKFRPKIAEHDYATKKGHVERFLKHKDKVKVTIMFRGREVTHPERGVMILDRLAEDLNDLAIVEQRPIQDGRNMTMMLGPSKAVLAGTLEEERAEAAAAAEAAAEQTASDAEAAASVPSVNGEPEAAPAAEPEPAAKPEAEPAAESEPPADEATPADDAA